VTRFDYEPYGKRLSSSGPPDPFQFASGYYDPEFDLTKFGTRYHDPNTTRWTQQDPVLGSLGDPKTLNPFAYVGDDPVNYVDLSGLASIKDVAGGGAGGSTVWCPDCEAPLVWSWAECGYGSINSLKHFPLTYSARNAWSLWRTGELVRVTPAGFIGGLAFGCATSGLNLGGAP
jgi:RHS repeat-associated protein